MTYKTKNKKLSCRKIAYFIKDEKKASAEYKKLGFPKLSADEKRHEKFFRKLKKENCKK